jgi:hypothetical protein
MPEDSDKENMKKWKETEGFTMFKQAKGCVRIIVYLFG